MGKALAAACLVLAACQPMYVGKSERLPPMPPPKPQPKAVAEVVPYVEDCDVNFSARPTTKRETPVAERLIVSADATTQQATRQTSAEQRVSLVRQAIEMYSDALRKDPYNADATLKLALAYDRVLRKGCALAMLRRLGTLADHPKLVVEAEPQVSLVVSNPHWFRNYRAAALKAIGQ